MWFFGPKRSLPPGVTNPLSFVSIAVLIAAREKPPRSIAALNAHRAVPVSTSKLETSRRIIRCRSAPCARTGFFLGNDSHTVPRYELMIAPLTAGQFPDRNCGDRFAPVSTSRCGSCSDRNCFTIVDPAGVAVQSHRAWAPEFFTLVSSAVKSVVAGEKIVVSTTCSPYARASFATCAGPSRPKPPLSPISQTREIFSFRRYAASLYA